MPDRDIQAIRLVGSLAVGLGAVLLVLTILTALFLLFTGGSTDLGVFARGAIAVMVAIIMATTLIGCGTTLARTQTYSHDADALRLNWTALFAMMLLTGVANLCLVPQLSIAAGFIMLGLLLIRGPIIDLTSH
jgi:hypothetical protein